MSSDLPNSAVMALHVICEGVEFVLDDGAMGVRLPNSVTVALADGDLAALEERALVRITDDEAGRPIDVSPTAYGRDWLKRWRAINGRPNLLLIPGVKSCP